MCALCLGACDGLLGDDPPTRQGDGSVADGSADGSESDGGTDGSMPDAGLRCADGPLAAPIEGCNPTAAPPSGDPAADCVARINQFRWECQCLPPLGRWTEGESCAEQHGEYDSTRSAHAGFRANICEPGGSAQNECPGWSSINETVTSCLKLMWNEGPGEPFSEHGHYINMSSTQYTKVACGFYTAPNGRVWAIQNFSR